MDSNEGERRGGGGDDKGRLKEKGEKTKIERIDLGEFSALIEARKEIRE